MRIQVIVLVDESPLDLKASIDSLGAPSLQGKIDLAFITRAGHVLSDDFWQERPALMEQLERLDLMKLIKGEGRFDVGRISAQRVMIIEAGDVILPDSVRSVVDSGKPSTEIIVGMMQSSENEPHLKWLIELARSGAERSIVTHPRLLSVSSYRGKIYSSVYLRGLLGGLENWDEASLQEASYLAMLGSKRVSVVGESTYARPDRMTDRVVHADVSEWTNFLRIAEAGYKRKARLSVEQRKAVDYHFVREGMERFYTAREIFDEDELRVYFSRARLLAGECLFSRILGIAGSLRFRLAFYALLADDFELFADPNAEITSLSAVNNFPYLSTKKPIQEEYRALIEVKGPRVFAEYSSVDNSGKLFLSGRAVFPGLFGAELSDISGKLRVGESVLGHPFSLQLRRPLPTNESLGVYEWKAEILPGREFFRRPIDFQIDTLDGSFTVRLRYTLGFTRTSRSLTSARGITQFFPADDHRVVIKHFNADKRANLKFAWHKSMVRDDFRAYRAGRPLAWWRIVKLLTGFIGRRNYWLLGERSDTAQDSSAILFDWLRKETKDVRPRYVVLKDTPAWGKMKKKGGVIAHGSLWHKLILLHAQALISTQDIDSYMIPNDWDRAEFRTELAPRLNQVRVFLQHGVTHNGVGPQLHRGVTGLDLLVCASPQEAAYLRTTTGYDAEIIETGFPRFDRLFDARSMEKTRSILLMPTWRRYLVAPSYDQNAEDPGNFVGSQYEQFFTNLLTSIRLQEALEESRVEIDFVPHYETASYFKAEKLHSQIHIITDGGARLPELLASTPLLVTDYSSVMFDVAYAGGGVVQLLFDYEDFYTRHYARGWYDPKSQGLGMNAFDVDEAIDVILGLIGSNFAVDDEHKARVNSYFSRHDAESRRRVYAEILGAIAKGRGSLASDTQGKKEGIKWLK